MHVDRELTLETLAALVRINSVNPGTEAGGPGEAEVAAYTATWLEAHGLEVERHEPEPGRISVVGRLRGSGGGRSLMLNAHSDTVGVSGMADPFGASVRDGRLYGRGAYDMKGSLAACMTAAAALAAAGRSLRGDVVVAAVADEEDASIGTRDIAAKYPVDAAIVTEPTALDICLAHKGFVWLEVVTRGRAAHGSRYDLGVDANLRMGRVLHELETHERELRARPSHSLVGTASLHAALLEGGSGPSTYAARCRLQIERRTLPGESQAGVVAEIGSRLERLRERDPTFDVELRTLLVREPFEVAPTAEIVRQVAACVRQVTGRAPRFTGEWPWMDSALLAAAGVECVVLGPAGAGAHSNQEWVDLESVYQLGDVLIEIARRYCA